MNETDVIYVVVIHSCSFGSEDYTYLDCAFFDIDKAIYYVKKEFGLCEDKKATEQIKKMDSFKDRYDWCSEAKYWGLKNDYYEYVTIKHIYIVDGKGHSDGMDDYTV